MTPGQRAMAPRVAVLVYNDAANDSRVLKESATLRDDGYDVRIIAVERRKLGRMAQVTSLGERLALERVPEFAIERVLPSIAPWWRRLINEADSVEANDPAPVPRSRPGTGLPRRALDEVPAVRSLALRTLRSIGERAFRTVSLGTYWKNATAAGLRLQPDIIHANDANTLVPALAIRALTRGGTGIVYDSHELWRHRNVRSGRILAPLAEVLTETFGIRQVDGVITVSPSIAEWLQRTYRLEDAPTLVRNVPIADALPDPSTGVLRERAGLSDADKVIAYGGRITTARGIEETIAALPHLPPDIHFVLLGYGEAAALDAVRAEAVSRGVEDRVHLVGAVDPDDVSRSLADGDVAVVHVRPICLSYRYALPNKLFESIRAGLPIAAADLPDMRQVVEELGVGEVFQGSEPEDLAAALAAILEDPEAYRARARAVAPKLTWENETEKMLEMYRRILRRRKDR
ncbi:glycosyltransferase [Brachybacterium sp. JB7]|uniref:Uncharacterized protein n=2 Tax=Dermabacteraceae TaxID=85020 RepID=A0A2A3YIT2_9MICO|nr:hypothetical protein CIK66_09930 [Brachybacterium alimentarium]RCS64732.1 glycosyltransferase [Brachybacterium sp. JB7]RCS66553.1 glycosyltransferase [Brachybacterium alimentarium]RCS89232.1 glycosyltransferase [Brachybacterium alimentarium]